MARSLLRQATRDRRRGRRLAHEADKLIRRAGIEELEAQCGGSCACATCHVCLTLPDGTKVAETTPGEARSDDVRPSLQV